MELFLAKLFGIYFIIIGAVVLFRRKAVMPTVRDLFSNRALLLVIAVVEIAAGLALVLAYPVVLSLDFTGVLSLVGYMMVVEGVIYLGASTKFVKKVAGTFNRPFFYIAGGILAIIAGIYLAGIGFGAF
ncbi:MAG TPA: hypothetical protein VHO23_02745 [Candidatus Paceibacterota bacterium]|nr:hypothetical protein [Candidatus Paceibacterota bacterium]